MAEKREIVTFNNDLNLNDGCERCDEALARDNVSWDFVVFI